MAKFAFKNKVLPSIMAATLASGMTLSGNANAIHLADNGIGQTLLGPVYLVDYGYTTKVSIVNTRTDIAVKAKIVIRSSKTGTELLDFLCYLSPADVCRFEIIKQDVDGDGNAEVVMYSDDDSVKSPVPDNVTNVPLVNSMEKSRATFASIRPVAQPLFTYKLDPNDPEDKEHMGHIEVIGVYGVRGTVTGYSPRSGQDPKPVSITVTQGMSKFALAQIFDTPRYESHNDTNKFWQPIIPLDAANSTTELTERKTGDKAPYSRLTASRIRSTDPSWVQLTGEVELVSLIDRIGYRFAALAGSLGDNVPYPYSVPDGLPGGTTAVWDGLVVSNPKFDVNIANESGIGYEAGIIEGHPELPGLDKIVEIEAALATTNIIDTFEDTSKATHDVLAKRTRMLITFPTRYRHRGNSWCNTAGIGANQYSSPFVLDGGAANYTLTALNNFEQTPGTPEIVITGTPFSGGKVEEQQKNEDPLIKGLNEVNYFIPDWPQTEVDENGVVLHNVIDFRSGWFDMTLLPRGGCENYYPGIPALGLTHKYVETSKGYTQSWLVSAGHKPILCCDTKDGTSCPSKKPWWFPDELMSK